MITGPCPNLNRGLAKPPLKLAMWVSMNYFVLYWFCVWADFTHIFQGYFTQCPSAGEATLTEGKYKTWGPPQYKDRLTSVGITLLKIRRSHDRLIFNTGILMPGKDGLCNETRPLSHWPSDAIWRWRSWSTLVQVMACCLTAPSHYLNHFFFTIPISKARLRITFLKPH